MVSWIGHNPFRAICPLAVAFLAHRLRWSSIPFIDENRVSRDGLVEASSHSAVDRRRISSDVDRRHALALVKETHGVDFVDSAGSQVCSGDRGIASLCHDGRVSDADDAAVSHQSTGRLLDDSRLLDGESHGDCDGQNRGDGDRCENVCRLPRQIDDDRVVPSAARLVDRNT